MNEYAVEKRETAPKNFFAGDFPTVPETGTAGADIKEYAPVMVDTASDNKIINRHFCGSSRKRGTRDILHDR